MRRVVAVLVGLCALALLGGPSAEQVDARGRCLLRGRACVPSLSSDIVLGKKKDKGDVDVSYPTGGNVPGGGLFFTWGYKAGNVVVKKAELTYSSMTKNGDVVALAGDTLGRWAFKFHLIIPDGTPAVLRIHYQKNAQDFVTDPINITIKD